MTTAIRRAVRFALPAVLVLLAGAAVAAEPAHTHAGHAGHAGHNALTLDHGRPWATDATLRQGMAHIRAAIADALPGIHHGTASADDYRALAAKVEGDVGSIFAGCHLPPAADAQLHIVLSQVVDGVDRMRNGDSDAARHAGVERVIHALDAYGKHFDDPGFQPLAP